MSLQKKQLRAPSRCLSYERKGCIRSRRDLGGCSWTISSRSSGYTLQENIFNRWQLILKNSENPLPPYQQKLAFWRKTEGTASDDAVVMFILEKFAPLLIWIHCLVFPRWVDFLDSVYDVDHAARDAGTVQNEWVTKIPFASILVFPSGLQSINIVYEPLVCVQLVKIQKFSA